MLADNRYLRAPRLGSQDYGPNIPQLLTRVYGHVLNKISVCSGHFFTVIEASALHLTETRATFYSNVSSLAELES